LEGKTWGVQKFFGEKFWWALWASVRLRENVKQHMVANAATSDISQNLIQTPKSSIQNLIRKSNQSYTPLILFQISAPNATDDLHCNS